MHVQSLIMIDLRGNAKISTSDNIWYDYILINWDNSHFKNRFCKIVLNSTIILENHASYIQWETRGMYIVNATID